MRSASRWRLARRLFDPRGSSEVAEATAALIRSIAEKLELGDDPPGWREILDLAGCHVELLDPEKAGAELDEVLRTVRSDPEDSDQYLTDVALPVFVGLDEVVSHALELGVAAEAIREGLRRPLRTGKTPAQYLGAKTSATAGVALATALGIPERRWSGEVDAGTYADAFSDAAAATQAE